MVVMPPGYGAVWPAAALPAGPAMGTSTAVADFDTVTTGTAGATAGWIHLTAAKPNTARASSASAAAAMIGQRRAAAAVSQSRAGAGAAAVRLSGRAGGTGAAAW